MARLLSLAATTLASEAMDVRTNHISDDESESRQKENMPKVCVRNIQDGTLKNGAGTEG